jgi:hypothetical protein
MAGNWLSRLKQRNVFRVTALYAVTGYAVFQISNNLLPALKLPSWSQTLLARWMNWSPPNAPATAR